MKNEIRASELREKTDAELLTKRDELEREKFTVLCSVAASGEKKQSAKVGAIRKEIARILTIIRERELEQLLREPLL